MTPQQHTTYDRLRDAGWEFSHDGEMDGHGVSEVHMQRTERHPEFVRVLERGVIRSNGRFVSEPGD